MSEFTLLGFTWAYLRSEGVPSSREWFVILRISLNIELNILRPWLADSGPPGAGHPYFRWRHHTLQ